MRVWVAAEEENGHDGHDGHGQGNGKGDVSGNGSNSHHGNGGSNGHAAAAASVDRLGGGGGVGAVDPIDAPIFIVGSPRSGTTWVQRLLVAHPAVCGGQESHFFAAFGPPLRSMALRAPGKRAVGLACYFTLEEFGREVRGLWRRMMSRIVQSKPGASVLVEKTPNHAIYTAEIATLFPKAKFIHVIRDSRGAVASMLAASESEWGRDWAPKGVRAATWRWKQCVREARQAGKVLGPGRYTEVYYEKLLADPEGGAAGLLKFIGVGSDPAQVKQIVESQAFDRQRQIGGTPFTSTGEYAKVKGMEVEPQGFFRSGRADSWKTDLTLTQKLIVWWRTRDILTECGYRFDGGAEFLSNGAAAAAAAAAAPPEQSPAHAGCGCRGACGPTRPS